MTPAKRVVIRDLLSRATKGPWTSRPGVDDEDYVELDGTSKGRVSTAIPWACFAKVVVKMDDEPSPEGEANAELIRSLPELLEEALKALDEKDAEIEYLKQQIPFVPQ